MCGKLLGRLPVGRQRRKCNCEMKKDSGRDVVSWKEEGITPDQRPVSGFGVGGDRSSVYATAVL